MGGGGKSAVVGSLTTAAHLLPLFPCMRNTIPPVTIGTGGISSVQRLIFPKQLETYLLNVSYCFIFF